MFRSAMFTILTVSALIRADIAFAQSPPLCPQGSWPVRGSGSQWVCSKNLPSDMPPAASDNSSPPSHGRRNGGGGMPQ